MSRSVCRRFSVTSPSVYQSLVMLWRPARTLSLDAQLFALPDTFSNAIASPSRKLSHRAGVSV